MKVMRLFRFVLATFLGLIVLSVVAEGVEIGLVSAVNGGMPSPDDYFDVRNQPFILGLKFIYNSVAAIIAGFVVAWIAKADEMRAAVTLAVVQTLLFIWGMTLSEYAGSLHLMVWIPITLLMIIGIVLGAFLKLTRRVT